MRKHLSTLILCAIITTPALATTVASQGQDLDTKRAPIVQQMVEKAEEPAPEVQENETIYFDAVELDEEAQDVEVAPEGQIDSL